MKREIARVRYAAEMSMIKEKVGKKRNQTVCVATECEKKDKTEMMCIYC